ncbi:MAG: hypothetical protein AB1564_01945 [Chloroflexota bacterium]
MKTQIVIAQLAIILGACAPLVTPLPTEIFIQTGVSPTATTVYPTSSPIPTQPPLPIFTPDAIQIERWQEYQTELAKALFVYNPSFPIWGYGPDAYTDALCEWDILRQRGQQVYVWVACAPASNSPLKGNSRVVRQNPAVIYLEPNGAVRGISVAEESIDHQSQLLVYDLNLFSIDIQEILCMYYFINVLQCYDMFATIRLDYLQSRQSVLASHLKFRESHPGEPPLIVLSATPTP